MPAPGAATVDKTSAGEQKVKESTESNLKAYPQIVFVGQLAYTTKEDDIRQHFETCLGGATGVVDGLPNIISIRMMTDSQTKKFKGTAFVELKNQEMLVKSVEMLHHSKLKGRAINVEKTLAGRKSQARDLRIKDLRTSQKIKASEVIDNLLNCYEKKKVLPGQSSRIMGDSLLQRLYAFTASQVTQILDNYAQEATKQSMGKPPSVKVKKEDMLAQSDESYEASEYNDKCVSLLTSLVTEVDGGGSAVDQSKQKPMRRGSFSGRGRGAGRDGGRGRGGSSSSSSVIGVRIDESSSDHHCVDYMDESASGSYREDSHPKEHDKHTVEKKRKRLPSDGEESSTSTSAMDGQPSSDGVPWGSSTHPQTSSPQSHKRTSLRSHGSGDLSSVFPSYNRRGRGGSLVSR